MNAVADETRAILVKIRTTTRDAEDALDASDTQRLLDAVRTIAITANDLVRGTLSPPRQTL